MSQGCQETSDIRPFASKESLPLGQTRFFARSCVRRQGRSVCSNSKPRALFLDRWTLSGIVTALSVSEQEIFRTYVLNIHGRPNEAKLSLNAQPCGKPNTIGPCTINGAARSARREFVGRTGRASQICDCGQVKPLSFIFIR